jgi:hypothetical protein
MTRTDLEDDKHVIADDYISECIKLLELRPTFESAALAQNTLPLIKFW